MKPTGIDPDYLRYRRNYPRFPGVTTCLDLLRRSNVHGGYQESVMGDLGENASEKIDELIAAFRAETDERVRILVLSVIADARSQKAFPLLLENLTGPHEDLRGWAAYSLSKLDTKEARRALWQAQTEQFDDPAETERFRKLLQEVTQWK